MFPSLFRHFAPHNLPLLIILDEKQKNKKMIPDNCHHFGGTFVILRGSELCARLQSVFVATVNTKTIKGWKRIDSVLLCRICLSTSSPRIRRN